MSFLDEQVSFIEAPARAWSKYQEDVFAAAQTSRRNLIIQAVAGSGKSTTLEELSKRVGDAILLAFNRSNAEDLKKRGLNARTFNSLGWWLWKQNRPEADMDSKKPWKHLEKLIGKSQMYWENGSSIIRAVSIAKSMATGLGEAPWASEFEDIIENFQLDIEVEQRQECAKLALDLFKRTINDLTSYDYDDQVYIPVSENWEFPQYSTLCVDEFQDLNPLQHIVISIFARKGSRIIAVGDRYQSIYAFRGAVTDSMDLAKHRFDMLELPLSISYRCSHAVVEEAKLLVPQIEPRADASAGRLAHFDFDESPRHSGEWHPEQMIICRNNAPLFRTILKEIRAGRRVRVLSNFLDQIEKFVKKHSKGITRIEDFRHRLDEWYAAETAELDARNVPKLSGKRAGLWDRYDTYIALCDRCQTAGNLLQTVKDLAESTSGPLFSTIHKAKGLEAERVHLLGPDLLPAFYAQGAEALQQEMNLKYVAITRAKEEFAYGERIMK